MRRFDVGIARVIGLFGLRLIIDTIIDKFKNGNTEQCMVRLFVVYQTTNHFI